MGGDGLQTVLAAGRWRLGGFFLIIVCSLPGLNPTFSSLLVQKGRKEAVAPQHPRLSRPLFLDNLNVQFILVFPGLFFLTGSADCIMFLTSGSLLSLGHLFFTKNKRIIYFLREIEVALAKYLSFATGFSSRSSSPSSDPLGKAPGSRRQGDTFKKQYFSLENMVNSAACTYLSKRKKSYFT